MKLKRFSAVLIAIALFLIPGTASKANDPGDILISPGPQDNLPVEKVDADNYPPEVMSYIEANKEKANIIEVESGNEKYIIITAGEKPTGGYSLDISRADESADGWLIDITLNEPSPDDIVTQPLTYPVLVLKKTINTDIRVRLWSDKGANPSAERLIPLIGEEDRYPDKVKELIEKYKYQMGIMDINIDKTTYTVIFAGMKPYSGYLLDIKSTSEKDGCKFFDVSLSSPDKGQMVLQVINYPYLVIKTEAGEKSRVLVKDESSGSFIMTRLIQ